MSAELDRIRALVDTAFDTTIDHPLRETQAFVLAVDGAIVVERYADGFDAASTFISWSMAKSMTSAMVGVLVGEGRLDLDAPAAVPEWHNDPGDPRAEITLRHLLQMRSGLEWSEDYVDAGVSDVIEMLFGSGQHDVASFAAAKPLVAAPGEQWLYSSGTTNIIARIAGDVVGGQAGVDELLGRRLLATAGLSDVSLRFDDAGTFIGSSFAYATARDFLAFGELYRNDGVVDGERLLPEGWVEASVTEHAVDDESGQGYGLQWWLARDRQGSYAANGYEGQRLQVVPAAGATFVRLGKTDAAFAPQLRAFYAAVADALNPF